MHSHEVDYKIIGQDIQLLEIELDPNETVIAEAGAMIYMEQDIDFETKMEDGSGGIFDTLFDIGSVWVQSVPFLAWLIVFWRIISLVSKSRDNLI